MNMQELTKVVAKIQLGDNRQVDQAIVREWYDTIGHLNFEDAIKAVTMHRLESTDYLQPAHIARNVNRVRELRAVSRGDVYCPHHAWYPLPCQRCAEMDLLRDGATDG